MQKKKKCYKHKEWKNESYFQDCDYPAHFDKLLSFCNKRLKKTEINNKSCNMVNTNSFTIQGKFITIHSLNSLQ